MNRRNLIQGVGAALTTLGLGRVFKPDAPVYFMIRRMVPAKAPLRSMVPEEHVYVLRPGRTLTAPGGNWECVLIRADGSKMHFEKTSADTVWVGKVTTEEQRVHCCAYEDDDWYDGDEGCVVHQCDEECYRTETVTEPEGKPWLVMPT